MSSLSSPSPSRVLVNSCVADARHASLSHRGMTRAHDTVEHVMQRAERASLSDDSTTVATRAVVPTDTRSSSHSLHRARTNEKEERLVHGVGSDQRVMHMPSIRAYCSPPCNLTRTMRRTLERAGVVRCSDVTERTTHVLVLTSTLSEPLEMWPHVRVVRWDWLEACVRARTAVPTAGYDVLPVCAPVITFSAVDPATRNHLLSALARAGLHAYVQDKFILGSQSRSISAPTRSSVSSFASSSSSTTLVSGTTAGCASLHARCDCTCCLIRCRRAQAGGARRATEEANDRVCRPRLETHEDTHVCNRDSHVQPMHTSDVADLPSSSTTGTNLTTSSPYFCCAAATTRTTRMSRVNHHIPRTMNNDDAAATADLHATHSTSITATPSLHRHTTHLIVPRLAVLQSPKVHAMSIRYARVGVRECALVDVTWLHAAVARRTWPHCRSFVLPLPVPRALVLTSSLCGGRRDGGDACATTAAVDAVRVPPDGRSIEACRCASDTPHVICRAAHDRHKESRLHVCGMGTAAAAAAVHGESSSDVLPKQTTAAEEDAASFSSLEELLGELESSRSSPWRRDVPVCSGSASSVSCSRHDRADGESHMSSHAGSSGRHPSLNSGTVTAAAAAAASSSATCMTMMESQQVVYHRPDRTDPFYACVPPVSEGSDTTEKMVHETRPLLYRNHNNNSDNLGNSGSSSSSSSTILDASVWLRGAVQTRNKDHVACPMADARGAIVAVKDDNVAVVPKTVKEDGHDRVHEESHSCHTPACDVSSFSAHGVPQGRLVEAAYALPPSPPPSHHVAKRIDVWCDVAPTQRVMVATEKVACDSVRAVDNTTPAAANCVECNRSECHVTPHNKDSISHGRAEVVCDEIHVNQLRGGIVLCPERRVRAALSGELPASTAVHVTTETNRSVQTNPSPPCAHPCVHPPTPSCTTAPTRSSAHDAEAVFFLTHDVKMNVEMHTLRERLPARCALSTTPEACTHMITGRPTKTEPFLCCVAAGRWILMPSFLHAVMAHGALVPEHSHEWCATQAQRRGQRESVVMLVQSCALQRQARERPYMRWSVVVLCCTAAARADSFAHVLRCGGCPCVVKCASAEESTQEVVQRRWGPGKRRDEEDGRKDADAAATSETAVVVLSDNGMWTRSQLLELEACAHGQQVLRMDYLVHTLCNPDADRLNFVLHSTQERRKRDRNT